MMSVLIVNCRKQSRSAESNLILKAGEFETNYNDILEEIKKLGINF